MFPALHGRMWLSPERAQAALVSGFWPVPTRRSVVANIMIRKNDAGGLVFYLPKRDLEDNISSIEFDTPEKWGGELKLASGGTYYIQPQEAPARLPVSVRAKRVDAPE